MRTAIVVARPGRKCLTDMRADDDERHRPGSCGRSTQGLQDPFGTDRQIAHAHAHRREDRVAADLDHAAHEGLELWSCDILSAYILSPLQDGQEVFPLEVLTHFLSWDKVWQLSRSIFNLVLRRGQGKI